MVMALALAAAWEWAKLSGYGTSATLAYLAAILLLLCMGAGIIPANFFFSAQSFFLQSTVFWIFIVPLWLVRGYKTRHPGILALAGWMVIVPAALAMIVLQRPYELLALMAAVWVSDVAAYFTGRAFGKHKLAPQISPGKTWEGVAGALVATLIYAEGMQRMGFSFSQTGAPGYSLKITALFMLLACLGMVGDLFESWMKRTAGVKDSGSILPGHGGVLDRIDALTSTLPIAALALGFMGKLN